MAKLKTQKTDASVQTYLNSIKLNERREDCTALHQLMKEVTDEPGSMWGEDIVGYGSYHYVYDSGREGDWMLTGFSSRKNSISVYLMSGFQEFEEELSRLGKHKTGKSCLYIQKLEDIDIKVLESMIRTSIKIINKRYKR